LKSDQAAVDRLLAEYGRAGFLAVWLRHRGADWAADLIPDLPNLTPGPEAETPQGPDHPQAEET
jgi:type IV secretion system protein VirB4